MYEPTAADEPRPAPPAPDTPNSGKQHSFASEAAGPEPATAAAPEQTNSLLTRAVECAVLGWIALDVLSRVF